MTIDNNNPDDHRSADAKFIARRAAARQVAAPVDHHGRPTDQRERTFIYDESGRLTDYRIETSANPNQEN